MGKEVNAVPRGGGAVPTLDTGGLEVGFCEPVLLIRKTGGHSVIVQALIQGLRQLRQEDMEFGAILGYTLRLSFKKEK